MNINLTCVEYKVYYIAVKLRNKSVYNVFALNFDIQLFFHHFSHATTKRVKNEIFDPVQRI